MTEMNLTQTDLISIFLGTDKKKPVKQEAPGQGLTGVTGDQIRCLITFLFLSCFVVTFHGIATSSEVA